LDLGKWRSGKGREVCTLSGHSGGVERVRFHPVQSNILCTAAGDRTVLLWDARVPSGSSNSAISSLKYSAKIDLLCNIREYYCPASIEFSPDGCALMVSEKDNSVHIYDMRKIMSSSSGSSSSFFRSSNHAAIGKPLKTYRLEDTVLECHFSPSGKHLVAATKAHDGMGTVRIWPFSETISSEKYDVYPGHTGAIYCLCFSPCGKRLATGGQDALVGLWDVAEMVCTNTIGRMTKFLRSVTFSHDSKVLASSSEETLIDLADANTGEKLSEISTRHGADEMAWNPKYYALAYASGEPDGSGIVGTTRMGPPPSVVTVVKFSSSL